jgi:hypothetical protein
MSDQMEYIVSEAVEVIGTLKRATILKMVRFSWWSPKESSVECDIQDSEVFSYTEGPLLIYLEGGEVIGFGSDESKNSIVLWFERDSEGNVHDGNIENDEELFAVDFNDQCYSDPKWNLYNGKKIESMKLIKRAPMNVKYEELPNEVALQITVQGGGAFVVCHQLCGKNTNFAIIDSDNIVNSLVGELSYIEV